jgi:hypothetical protein
MDSLFEAERGITVKKATPVPVKEVSIGAGAKIEQILKADPYPLDSWKDTPDAVMTLYFVFQEKFEELNILPINVRQVVGDILESDPLIGMPIDSTSQDLEDWARTLKNHVKLWEVQKFVEFNNPSGIVYEFPEEFKTVLNTEEENDPLSLNSLIFTNTIDLADLIHAELLTIGEKLTMTYKPRNGQQKRYEASILEDGSLDLLGQHFSSPSYAALAGIQDAGSDRKTVNGWTSWKNDKNQSLSDLRDELHKSRTEG